MKTLLLAALLAITFASPAVAVSKPKTVELSYAITDNRHILTIWSKVNPDNHLIKVAPKNEGWFRAKHGFMPFDLSPGGVPMVADTGFYIPDTSNMVADAVSNGFLRDGVTGALVVSTGSGTFNASIAATFNTTAPALTNGQTTGLQVDANGALIVANGGKTYIQLNAANVTCTNLFTVAVRVTTITNPGIAQAHPFVLYDENTAACTGFSIWGNTHANEATGPVMGPGQVIQTGVRTTNGLTYEWFGGGVTTGSIPFIQVQMIFPVSLIL